jgi:hypothetical protein
MTETDEKLLAFVRDPIETALRLGIRRLGQIASGFMTIGEMVELANEAAPDCGDPGVRGVIIDKQWDGLRDRSADCWIA